ncbi:LacI family DNA-binding transcriptional regulator [Treponema brennaborense]|uniref:Transcriptional regulator, LacI family n=1 Tax=Treponema brennaborense (strain DSM 12168 / CIP 105900 / DD5/3) TaxID=906968 RepID=F4LP34_TREBD|nr:LacI family DNA-binding transcriptional regulator [Treponema brennaborense]AEE15910.1 transcriptional regulator, LacI family [Treponema brennaborense DSM 12168]
MARITMQDIADELGVSRISVWKVFNNVDTVSPVLKSRILDKASELGYVKAAQLAESRLCGGETNVAVVVSRPESSTFWSTIIHSMAETFSCEKVNLLYVYVPSRYSADFVFPEILRHHMVDGIVVINVYDTEILDMLNALPMAKVFLDITTDYPFLRLKGDLVLLEGKQTVKLITGDLIRNGCTRIGFIGDIKYALTNKLRYEGYTAAITEAGLVCENDYLFYDKIGINEYYASISDYLDSVTSFPDAYVCVSDFVAHFIYRYFLEHPRRLKNPLVVTGYDGSFEYPAVADSITTARVDTRKIGKLLADRICYRIKNPSMPKEISYVFPEVILKDSCLTPVI